MEKQCPKCGSPISIPGNYINKTIKCPSCGHKFFLSDYEPKPIPPKINLKSQLVVNETFFEGKGLYLRIIGWFGIGFSLLSWVGQNYDMMDIVDSGIKDIILTLIGIRTLLGIMASFILIGIGTIVKNLKK